MQANTDDIYADRRWVQLAAVPLADSADRHPSHPGAIEQVPAWPSLSGLRKEAGPAALGPSAARSTRRRATHLTRRGRLVLTLLATCLVVVAFGAGRASATPAKPAALPTVVVQDGDTLWSIAACVAGRGDIRETIERITALNGVAAQSLQPGQRLILPVRERPPTARATTALAYPARHACPVSFRGPTVRAQHLVLTAL